MSLELVIVGALLTAAVALLGAVAVAGVLAWRYMDHRQRMERREAGLAEVPRDKRREKPREPMPDSVRKLIEPLQSTRARHGLEAEAYQLHEGGAPWEEIERKLREELRPDDEDELAEPVH